MKNITKTNKKIEIHGLIVNKRTFKNIIFLKIVNNYKTIQASINNLKNHNIEQLQIGTVVLFVGNLYKTRINILTIDIQEFKILLNPEKKKLPKIERSWVNNNLVMTIEETKNVKIEKQIFEYEKIFILNEYEKILNVNHQENNIYSEIIFEKWKIGILKFFNFKCVNDNYYLYVYLQKTSQIDFLKELLFILQSITNNKIKKDQIMINDFNNLIKNYLKINNPLNFQDLIKHCFKFEIIEDKSNFNPNSCTDVEKYIFDKKIKKFLLGFNLIKNFPNHDNENSYFDKDSHVKLFLFSIEVANIKNVYNIIEKNSIKSKINYFFLKINLSKLIK